MAAAAEQASAGSTTESWTATGVAIDSRTLEPGDLFVALRGPRFDGHDFLIDAWNKDAAAAMVSHVPAYAPAALPLLVVSDTEIGLRRLASAARSRLGGRVIAVTGSAGKTGTKNALAHVLGPLGLTHVSQASLNNQWGVPLSLARTPAEAVYAVYEIGMNHAGEIAPLAALVRPHVAIVTTVDVAHLEFFASVEAIAEAKAEIFTGLEPGGTAVINRDNPHFAHLAERARACGAQVIGFGFDQSAEVRAIKAVLHPECSCVSAEVLGQPITYKIGRPGRHWVMNSLAVLAAVKVVGADIGLVGLGLAGLEPEVGRGRHQRLAFGNGTIEVIDDSYNANPASMRAAFEVFGAMTKPPRARRIAVLGDMLELGPTAPTLHAALAVDIENSGIDLVFTAGPAMAALHEALSTGRRGAHAAEAADLVQPLINTLRPGDLVLVKGSHGSRMRDVLAGLAGLSATPRAAHA